MKKSISYKEITLVIGILVALLIALTLWTATPAADTVSRGLSPRVTGFVLEARHLFETTVSTDPFDLE